MKGMKEWNTAAGLKPLAAGSIRFLCGFRALF